MTTTRRTVPIDRVLTDRNLLGAALGSLETWSTWLTVLRAAFGCELAPDETSTFRSIAGDRQPPAKRVRELWAVCGRRSGKSRMAGAIGAYLGACIDYRRALAPGETGTVLILAPTTAQASVVFNYARAFLETSPILARQIEGITADEIKLKGNVVISVHPASYRSVRGRTMLAVIFDESAMWRSEESAVPDVEVYRAVIPALATTKGMLIGIGTPYRRLGLMFTRFRDCFAKDDPDVLVVHGPTTAFNSTIDVGLITQAERDDPQAALSEWQAEFRTDLSSFLDDASIDGAVNHARPLELPPRPGIHYRAFTDASAGRHDAYTLAIAHREGDRVIIDVLRGRHPPLDPQAVTDEYAELAGSYRCFRVTGDNYAAEWVASAWRKAGRVYEVSDLVRSELYLEGLPIFTRGLIELPDHPRLLRELRLLERRTHRSGRDTVDHGAGGSDDFANALFGAIHLVVPSHGGFLPITNTILARARLPAHLQTLSLRPEQPLAAVEQARTERRLFAQHRSGVVRF